MIRGAVAVAVCAVALGVPGARAASGADTFRMPSGNIYCAYEHYSFAPTRLRCEIRSHLRPMPPRPASCRDAAWGEGYSLAPRGPARVLCITDTVYDAGARVLAYGVTRQFGVFVCSSSTSGLRCVNATGDGFFMSKGHSYMLRQPPPRNGAFKTPSGNIVCGYGIAPDGTASMECGIKSGLKPPPRRIHCQAGDPNDKRVGLRDTGRATPVLCAGDPGPLLPQIDRRASVLAYGRTIRIGGIGCSSATAGLTCRNRSGHGFFLSRERWRMF